MKPLRVYESPFLDFIEMHVSVPTGVETPCQVFLGGGRVSDDKDEYLMFVCTQARFYNEQPPAADNTIHMWITHNRDIGVSANSNHTFTGMRRYEYVSEDNGAADRRNYGQHGINEYDMDFGLKGVPVPFRKMHMYVDHNFGSTVLCGVRLYGYWVTVTRHEYIFYQFKYW